MSADSRPRGLVLVVEDEPAIADVIRLNLAQAGYGVQVEHDGGRALDAVRRFKPAAIILDVGLPGLDGIEICRRLRADQDWTPVLFVTARDDEVDRILGLELGADDYITKPFSPRELVARVKAILRRTATQAEPQQVIRHGDLAIDVARHEVTFAGKPVSLTATEFRILHFLASKPGRVLSRDDIIDAALGRDANVFDRTIDVHITAIRRKLGKGADQIETIRGFGYKFRDTTPATA